MLNDWIKTIVEGKKSYGLEIIYKSEEEIEYKLIQTVLIKGQISIAENVKGSSFKELMDIKWDKSIPLFLSISGKGVLRKKVKVSNRENEVDIFQKALPNTKIDDFHFQLVEANSDFHWLMVLRKSLFQKVEGIFQNLGIHLLGLELGFLPIQNIAHLLNVDEINIDKLKLSLESNRLVGVEESTSPLNDRIDLAGENINSDKLMAFANSLRFFNPISGVEQNIFAINHREFTQHRIFKLGLIGALSFFLLLLLINFFVFQEYNTEYSNISQQLAINKGQLDKLKLLEAEVKRNEDFFKSTDLISSSRHAYYADKLAESKPQGISWNVLKINPSKRKIEKGEDVDFQIGLINIKGISDQTAVFDQWVKRLEGEDWIKSIDIKDYQSLEKSNQNAFFIQIRI